MIRAEIRWWDRSRSMTVITGSKINQGFMPQDGIANRSPRQLFPERFIDQFCKRSSYPLGRFVPLFLAILHLHSDVVHVVRVASCSPRRRSFAPFHAFSIAVSLRRVVKNRVSAGETTGLFPPLFRPRRLAVLCQFSCACLLRSRAAIIIRTV